MSILSARTLPLKFLPLILTHIILVLLITSIVTHFFTQIISPYYYEEERDGVIVKRNVALHLPSLSETGISGVSSVFFTLACVLTSFGMIAMGILGLFGAMETVPRGRVGMWRLMHRMRCVTWIIAGVSLYFVGTIPLHDIGSNISPQRDAYISFWERHNVSMPVHLTAAFLFFVSAVASMTLGSILSLHETRQTSMSKHAKFLTVMWKVATTLVAFVFWPVIPLLSMVAVVTLCDTSSFANIQACWVIGAEQTVGALVQYAFVLAVCEHLASYVWEMKHAGVSVNPDVTLTLFREINSTSYATGNDEFKVDSDLDDLASSDGSL